MKRITKYNIINIVVTLTYIAIMIVQSATKVFLINIKIFWFMAFLLAIGISLLFKFLIFKSDSSLWFGITLLLCGVTICVFVYLNLKFQDYFALFLISPIIGSLFVGLIFKDALQLKVIIYLICFMVPLILFNLKILNLIYCAIAILVSFVICVILFNFLPQVAYKLKNKKN